MEKNFYHVTLNTAETLELKLCGAWVVEELCKIESYLKETFAEAKATKQIIFNGNDIERLDTSVSWRLLALSKALKRDGKIIQFKGFSPEKRKILTLLNQVRPGDEAQEKLPWIKRFIAGIGRDAKNIWRGIYVFIDFIGMVVAGLGATLKDPSQFRFKSMCFHLYEVGVKAIPIIALMAFLISLVLGYQGAAQLKNFGAEIFTIDLVAISVLREMGVLLTAIMVAGRSGSAFAAQLGVMKVNEEIDAICAIGLDERHLLIIPRVVAILIALPLLTILADIMGLLGGGFISHYLLDISFPQYIARLKETITLTTFLLGLVKAPFFALIIGMVGCMRGMQVDGSAEKVGSQTTISVVESIFLVIVADAAFSILFSMWGL